ncbi:MAG TPA: MFS transporter, partial [Candidatus Acidoferrales bacterium]|nr:MFS transporter [Candidatus Acidoferrales bacterium]
MRSRLGPFAGSAFAIYWSGGLISNVGTWLQNVVGSVFVYERTGSALAVGLLNFATFAPMLLFSVFGGMISDRFDRRLVVVFTHLFSLAAASALAALAVLGTLEPVHVVVTAFVLQTSWTLAKPSVSAMLPALVPRAQLAEAVSLNTLQFMLAQLGGPLLATLLLATSGFALAFSINAASFVAPILAVTYLYARGLGGRASAAERRLVAAAGGAVAFIRREPWIAAVLLGVICTSAALEVGRTLSPVIASTRLGVAASEAGILVSAQSVGQVVGILTSVPFARRGFARTLAPIGFVLQLSGLLALSQATDVAIASVAVAAVGCGFSFAFPVLTGVIQTEVPDGVRGRLLAFHQMAHLG